MADLSGITQIEFDMMVHKEYTYNTDGKNLRATIREKNIPNEKSVYFRKVGSVIMNEGAFFQQVSIQDPGYEQVLVALKKYLVAIGVDDIEQFTVNFSEKQESAQLTAMATRRKEDQLVINALNASGTTKTIAEGGTNLTYDKVLQVIEKFDEIGVPANDRYLLISAAAQKSVMKEEEFTSSLYMDYKPIPRGGIDMTMLSGLKIILIPTMREGGLPKSGNIRSCFAYHKMALGYAFQNFTASIDKIPERDYWQIMVKLFAACGAIDADGIIKVDIDETK